MKTTENRTDRNQWKDSNKSTYYDMVEWSWSETEENAPQYFKRLAFSINNATGMVLEIGCGIGSMTKWLSKNPDVHHVVAIDAFEEAISPLKAFNFDKVAPIQMALQDISFDDNIHFDTVMICEVLEHLYPDEEDKMLKAIGPYISPATRFVISVPIDWLPDPHHVRGFSKEEFKDHLRDFYGAPVEIDYSSGYSQVAWGYFQDKVAEK